AEDGIRDFHVTGVQTCALPILLCVESGDNQPILEYESRAPLLDRHNLIEAHDERGRPAHDVAAEAQVALGHVEATMGKNLSLERSEERRVGKGRRAEAATGQNS